MGGNRSRRTIPDTQNYRTECQGIQPAGARDREHGDDAEHDKLSHPNRPEFLNKVRGEKRGENTYAINSRDEKADEMTVHPEIFGNFRGKGRRGKGSHRRKGLHRQRQNERSIGDTHCQTHAPRRAVPTA